MEPEQCTTLDEVRAEIDRIDRGIVEAIGKRRRYVMAAAKFKSSASAVAAPERLARMLEMRRQWAAEENLNPDAIEKLYLDLVNHFIEEELQEWKAQS
jgi:isochorismate pyruvate lyase